MYHTDDIIVLWW